MKVIYY